MSDRNGSPDADFASPGRMIAWLSVALVLTAAFALMVGGVGIPPAEVWTRLARCACGRGVGDAADRILWGTRLPRVLLTLLVGGSMGLAGVASQALFRNPLASPYVVGVSNGAAVGAVLGMLFASAWVGYWGVVALSVVFGLAVALAVFLLARRGGRLGSSLLLAGVAVGAFCSALTAGALYMAGERLQTLVFWLMGGLWQATWTDVFLMAPVCLAGLALLRLMAPAMNVALVGERSAGDLGVNVRRLQTGLLGLVAGTTAVSVSLTGVIGFVGLIVPHLLRLAMGADHRTLVPASMLGGALLLLVADTLARTVAAPAEVPVGILTALVGAPVFLWLLQRRGRGGIWM